LDFVSFLQDVKHFHPHCIPLETKHRQRISCDPISYKRGRVIDNGPKKRQRGAQKRVLNSRYSLAEWLIAQFDEDLFGNTTITHRPKHPCSFVITLKETQWRNDFGLIMTLG
jgi:hypothetical protein